jgi:hypothetical protein
MRKVKVDIMAKIDTFVKDYVAYETLKNFKGYLNIENTVTGKRIPLCANGFIYSFELSRYQNAKVQQIKGIGTNDVTLYITNKEWNACGLDFKTDDCGYPIGYFD